MKKVIILLVLIGFISCSTDEYELDNELYQDTTRLNNKCDCGIDNYGGGVTGVGGDDIPHIFESYDHYGDITVSGFTNIALNIHNISLLKFSYGLNISNGQIDNVALGNISPKSKVTLVDYSYDKDYYIFNLKVEGKIRRLVWDSEKQTYVWKGKTVYTYVVVKIETSRLTSYSESGAGGNVIFPYST